MSAIAHAPAAFALRDAGSPYHARSRASGRTCLTLWPTEDGWSLVGADGEVVFRALGIRGRRHCLEFARAHGIPAVLS